MKIHRVVLSRRAQKQLFKVPHHVVKKLNAWIEDVEIEGLQETRKIPGYHDESLRGKRTGQRSIRLTRSYRAIYEVKKELKEIKLEFVSVEEVNKHDY